MQAEGWSNCRSFLSRLHFLGFVAYSSLWMHCQLARCMGLDTPAFEVRHAIELTVQRG